jgi:hypothetical protein
VAGGRPECELISISELNFTFKQAIQEQIEKRLLDAVAAKRQFTDISW